MERNAEDIANRRDSLDVYYHAPRSEELARLGRLPDKDGYQYHGGRYAVNRDLPFGARSSFAVRGATWYYTSGARFEIARYDTSGVLRRVMLMDRARPEITRSQVRAVKEWLLGREEPRGVADLRKALDWLEFPRQAPAYRALNIDSEGILWAQVWTARGEPTLWDLFDSGDRFVGSVAGPVDFEALDVGRDYILGRRYVARGEVVEGYRVERR